MRVMIVTPHVLMDAPSGRLVPSVGRIAVTCIVLSVIGSIIHLDGMINFVEYAFGDDDDDSYYSSSSDTTDEEYETILQMYYWGYYWSISLWSLYHGLLFWFGKYQLIRLILSCSIFLIHCVLSVPLFIDASNNLQDIADSFDDASSEYYQYVHDYSQRSSLQCGAASGGLIAMIVVCLIIVVFNFWLSCSPNNLVAIKGSGYQKFYMILCVLMIVGLLTYLVTLSLVVEDSLESNALRFILSMIYGPAVICYDILSYRW